MKLRLLVGCIVFVFALGCAYFAVEAYRRYVAPPPVVTYRVGPGAGHPSFAVSGDESTIATWRIDGIPIRLWDVETGALRHELPETRFTSDVAFSDGGEYLVSWNNKWVDKFADIWDVRTGKRLVKVPYLEPENQIRARSFFPDESRSPDEVDPEPDLQMPEDGVDDFEHGAFSPDGSMMASVHFDRRMLLWSLRTGEVLFDTHVAETPVFYNQNSHLTFSDDGQLLVCGRPGSLEVWTIRGEDGNLAPTRLLALRPQSELERQLSGHGSTIAIGSGGANLTINSTHIRNHGHEDHVHRFEESPSPGRAALWGVATAVLVLASLCLLVPRRGNRRG